MGIRTLLVVKNDYTEFQVDIPDTYKVTFGPAFVGGTSAEKHGKIPMALRIYENEKMQLAIFTDVASFRDMSIPLRVKEVKIQEKDGFIECDGVKKRTTFQAKTYDWVNPDAKAEEQPKLLKPSDTEMFGEE